MYTVVSLKFFIQYDKNLIFHFLKKLFYLLSIVSCIITYAQKSPKDSAKILEEVVVVSPLNKSFEVNVGGFGAKHFMEIPLPIQSYSAIGIRDISARTVRDILISDPSVQSASYGAGFDNFRIRGFVMDNFNTIRREGLVLAPHYDMPLELIERVDVLKGPSGFLYGFNSPGGTINYIPKRPTKKSFSNFTLQHSSLQNYYTAFDQSMSFFNKKLGYRLNAGYEKIGDFNHLGDLERKFIGLAVDFRFSERALLQLSGDWTSKSNMADPLLRADQTGRFNMFDPGSYILPPRVNRRDALSPYWFRHEINAHNVEFKFDYKLNRHWELITQGNYSQVDRSGGYAEMFDIQPDGAIGRAGLLQTRGEVFSSWSVQSYLSGKVNTGSVKHDIFAGVGHRQFRDKSPFWDHIVNTNGIKIGDISVGNILHPVQPSPWDFGAYKGVEFNSSIRESSIFSSDLIIFSQKFQLLVGGRYIWYAARNLSAVALPQNKNVFVPTGAFIYRPNKIMMTYFSYSRGFEKGDYSPPTAINANQPTDAIASVQYELGLKMDIAKRFNMGMTLFDVTRNASYLNAGNYFVSDGKFHHRGIELTATGIFPQGLTLSGNIAYLETKLKNTVDPTTNGKRTEGAPRWKGTMGARYALPFLPGFFLDSNLNYVGERPLDAQNSGFVPGFILLDGGVSYETQLGGTTCLLRIHGRNLTDKYYYAGAIYSGGLEIGRTREVFLSVQFRL